MALALKPVCERCNASTPPDGAAFICTYECTFCPECAAALTQTCPNCGGELVRRPRRSHTEVR